MHLSFQFFPEAGGSGHEQQRCAGSEGKTFRRLMGYGYPCGIERQCRDAHCRREQPLMSRMRIVCGGDGYGDTAPSGRKGQIGGGNRQ